MRARIWFFGLAAATGLATSAAAEPPAYSVVELRPELSVGISISAPEASTPSALVTMTAAVWQTLLDQLTFPLGAATPPRERLGA